MVASIASPPGFVPELVLLLHDDPGDAVSRVLLERGAQLGSEVLPLSAAALLDEVEFNDSVWWCRGRRIEPSRTAVVNRLSMTAGLPTSGPEADAGSWAAWARLRHELERFGYVSSLPTATSILGCRGSLLDQWLDLPRLLPELASVRVPVHATPAEPRQLTGESVHSVNRWALYSLGQPRAAALRAGLAPEVRLDYVRPPGRLVTLAQVGGSMFFTNAPPEMTGPQADAIVAFARSLARVSRLRIAEHVFFLADATPVFYSTCPVPVISGSHPVYPDLVLQGLRDDFEKWGRGPDR